MYMFLYMIVIDCICMLYMYIHTHSYFTRTSSQFSTSMSTVRRVPYMNHQPSTTAKSPGSAPIGGASKAKNFGIL